jgi:hypothetical protein
MSRSELDCKVRDDELVVTLLGSGYSVTYFKPAELAHLLAKNFPRENEKGALLTQAEFLNQAWRLANAKAAALGLLPIARPMSLE